MCSAPAMCTGSATGTAKKSNPTPYSHHKIEWSHPPGSLPVRSMRADAALIVYTSHGTISHHLASHLPDHLGRARAVTTRHACSPRAKPESHRWPVLVVARDVAGGTGTHARPRARCGLRLRLDCVANSSVVPSLAREVLMRWGSCLGAQSAEVLRAVFDGQ